MKWTSAKKYFYFSLFLFCFEDKRYWESLERNKAMCSFVLDWLKREQIENEWKSSDKLIVECLEAVIIILYFRYTKKAMINCLVRFNFRKWMTDTCSGAQCKVIDCSFFVIFINFVLFWIEKVMDFDYHCLLISFSLVLEYFCESLEILENFLRFFWNFISTSWLCVMCIIHKTHKWLGGNLYRIDTDGRYYRSPNKNTCKRYLLLLVSKPGSR